MQSAWTLARIRPAIRGAAVFLALLLLVAGCAPLRDDYPVTPSHAFDRPQETSLGRAYGEAQAVHPGKSGFRLLNSGVSALLTRAALADLAERTLDVQYYIYEPDEVGVFLLERLVAAADRGVRVRMLLDDHELELDDRTLAVLDAHPNIEIRVFNPFPDRARWTRPFQLAFQLDRLGRRMHNKVFAADNQAAILGGRNISNRYFEAQSESHFRDVDVLATGPVVQEVSRHFDAYWNSTVTAPVAAFVDAAPHGTPAAHLAELHRRAADHPGPRAEYEQRRAEFVRRLLDGDLEMIWAAGRAIAEPPVRQKPGDAKPSSEIARAHAIVRQSLSSEMMMGAAYFVPGTRGVEVLSELTRRGVRVRILTNSLASTDVPAVHAGYARYRAALLEAGVALHEYRLDASRPSPPAHLMRMGRSESALHAKVVVYDRRIVWVGSANFDPRSRRLNTETGLMIESDALAHRLLASMERDFSPEQSWRLALETDPQTGARNVVWHGTRNGEAVRHEQEPDAGMLRGLSVFFYSLLPGIEELL